MSDLSDLNLGKKPDRSPNRRFLFIGMVLLFVVALVIVLIVSRESSKTAKPAASIDSTTSTDFATSVDSSDSTDSTRKNISEDKAFDIARGIIEGKVLQVLPFQQIDKQVIAVRYTTAKDNDSVEPIRLVVLEYGATYRKLLDRELSGNAFLENSVDKYFSIVDIEEDGEKEVFCSVWDGGTDGGTTTFMVIKVPSNKVFNIEVRTGNNVQKTISEQEVVASDNLKLNENKRILDFMQKRLVENKVLQNDNYDITNPKFAAQRFVTDNEGEMEKTLSGNPGIYKVKTHWYDNYDDFVCAQGNSITCEVGSADMIYKAFFRGPVFAVDKKMGRFYTIYASSDTYAYYTKLEVQDGLLMLYHNAEADVPDDWFNPETFEFGGYYNLPSRSE